MIIMRKCSCCGDKFSAGIFDFRCLKCQDNLVFTTDGIRGTYHKPCPYMMERIHTISVPSTTGKWTRYSTRGER